MRFNFPRSYAKLIKYQLLLFTFSINFLFLGCTTTTINLHLLHIAQFAWDDEACSCRLRLNGFLLDGIAFLVAFFGAKREESFFASIPSLLLTTLRGARDGEKIPELPLPFSLEESEPMDALEESERDESEEEEEQEEDDDDDARVASSSCSTVKGALPCLRSFFLASFFFSP